MIYYINPLLLPENEKPKSKVRYVVNFTQLVNKIPIYAYQYQARFAFNTNYKDMSHPLAIIQRKVRSNPIGLMGIELITNLKVGQKVKFDSGFIYPSYFWLRNPVVVRSATFQLGFRPYLYWFKLDERRPIYL